MFVCNTLCRFIAYLSLSLHQSRHDKKHGPILDCNIEYFGDETYSVRPGRFAAASYFCLRCIRRIIFNVSNIREMLLNYLE
jgi:hypothetical protein